MDKKLNNSVCFLFRYSFRIFNHFYWIMKLLDNSVKDSQWFFFISHCTKNPLQKVFTLYSFCYTYYSLNSWKDSTNSHTSKNGSTAHSSINNMSLSLWNSNTYISRSGLGSIQYWRFRSGIQSWIEKLAPYMENISSLNLF